MHRIPELDGLDAWIFFGWLTDTSYLQILRLLNTNVRGEEKVMYALTRIKGVGRRYSNLVCKKADVDLNKRYEIMPRGTWW